MMVLALIAGSMLALVPAPRAHAALPDTWGYGYREPTDSVPAYLNLSTDSAGMTGVVVGGSGNRYQLRFPNAGAPGGVVHVTAVSPSTGVPSWCQPDDWYQAGSDENVDVSCWVTYGGSVYAYPTGFSVMFTSATYTGPPVPDYAYAESDGFSGLITQFDSSGGFISDSPIGTGVWTVKLPGVGISGSTLGGDLQVTGVGPNPAHCKVGDWKNLSMAQLVTVLCFDGFGAPVNTKWNLTYQFKRDVRGKSSPFFGYFLQGSRATLYTNLDTATAGWWGADYSASTATGVAVVMPSLGFTWHPFSTAQATAFGPGPSFCRFGEPGGPPPWYDGGGPLVIRSVDCFDGGGSPVASDFFATYAYK